MANNTAIEVIEVSVKTGKFLRKYPTKTAVAKSTKSRLFSISSACKNKQVYRVKGRLFVDIPKGVNPDDNTIDSMCQTAWIINRLRTENKLNLAMLNTFNFASKAVLE